MRRKKHEEISVPPDGWAEVPLTDDGEWLPGDAGLEGGSGSETVVDPFEDLFVDEVPGPVAVAAPTASAPVSTAATHAAHDVGPEVAAGGRAGGGSASVRRRRQVGLNAPQGVRASLPSGAPSVERGVGSAAGPLERSREAVVGSLPIAGSLSREGDRRGGVSWLWPVAAFVASLALLVASVRPLAVPERPQAPVAPVAQWSPVATPTPTPAADSRGSGRRAVGAKKKRTSTRRVSKAASASPKSSSGVGGVASAAPVVARAPVAAARAPVASAAGASHGSSGVSAASEEFLP